MSMAEHLDPNWLGLFCQLYGVVICFADDPLNALAKIGGGQISVPGDQAMELDHYLRAIGDRYPDSSGIAVVRVAREIDRILARRSLGGEAFDEAFWTNEGFQEHPDWLRIRELARAFLLR